MGSVHDDNIWYAQLAREKKMPKLEPNDQTIKALFAAQLEKETIWAQRVDCDETFQCVDVAFAKVQTATMTELWLALHELLDCAEGCEDEGPAGEGWQSDKLESSCARARKILGG